jgi:hypothetical protein
MPKAAHHVRYEFGSGAEAYEAINPANPSEKVGRDAIITPHTLSGVIKPANLSQAQRARVPGLERSKRLNAFFDAVEARADEPATADTLEQGKLFRESEGGVSPRMALGTVPASRRSWCASKTRQGVGAGERSGQISLRGRISIRQISSKTWLPATWGTCALPIPERCKTLFTMLDGLSVAAPVLVTSQVTFVLIVGGGQGGLALGAHPSDLGVPYLIVDKYPKVGDQWRSRYASLVLHDPVWCDHMAFKPCPEGGRFHTKGSDDRLAGTLCRRPWPEHLDRHRIQQPAPR